MDEQQIPQEVLDEPADADGNGFLLGDVWSLHIVGPDGRIYSRRGGKITIETDDE